MKRFIYKYVTYLSMKTINVTFEDEEHERLDVLKGDMSWREFILQLLKK